MTSDLKGEMEKNLRFGLELQVGVLLSTAASVPVKVVGCSLARWFAFPTQLFCNCLVDCLPA